MSEIVDFFEFLSYRKSDENTLSDITWAFCEVNDDFKTVFLTFIFGQDEFFWKRINSFHREYQRDECRPDFYFKNGNNEYIIEVKINDTNQHFEQYDRPETFQNAYKGYITNYEINGHSNYFIKTWKEFRDYMKASDLYTNNELAKAYISYLEEVCVIEDIKKMNLQGIESLYHFNNAVKRVIKYENENYFSDDYKNTGKSLGIRQGAYFDLNFKKVQIKETFGWMGIYYNDQTLVCIEFDSRDGWGLPIFEILKKHEHHHTEGKYASIPYEDWGAYYFNLQESRLEEFEKADTSDKQIEILGSFFQEVICYVEKIATFLF